MGRVGNIETLRDEIIAQAREQEKIAIDREQRIAERDLNYAREDAEKIREQQRARTRSIAEIERKKTMASAEMEARKILLRKKEELVSRLFDAVESKLEQMRGSKLYIDIISKSIKDAVSNIGNNLLVEFDEKDKKIFTDKVIASIQSNLSASIGFDIKLKFALSSDNINAGVIIKSLDGKMIIDNSFTNLLKGLKVDMRGKVSEILLKE